MNSSPTSPLLLPFLLCLVMGLGLTACDSTSGDRKTAPIGVGGGSTNPGTGAGGGTGTGGGSGGGTGVIPGTGGTGGTGSTGGTGNAVPIALADVAVVQIGSTGNPLNVLANDSDANGDALTIASVTLVTSVPTASGAGATVAADGRSLRYTPPAGFIGTQTLRYTVGDGQGGVAAALVVVTVSPLALPPAALPDAFTKLIDAASSTLDVLANDLDGAGGGLTVTAASSLATVPTGGAGSVSVVDGALRYQPRAGFLGVETLSYTLTDANGATATAVAVITVLPLAAPPVALPDVATLPVGSSSDLDVLANDVDLAGGGLTITGVAAVASLPPGSEGSFSVAGNRVRYTPSSAGFIGTQTATYTIADQNGATATGLITLVVTPALPAVPPVAVPDIATRSAGSTSARLTVLDNDIDVAGGGLTISAASIALGLPDSTGVSVTTDGTALDLSLPATYAGVLTLSYTITDANGSTATTAAVVTVAPAALPAVPPVAVPDVALAAPATAALLDVLANDIDVAGGGLSLTAAAVQLSLPSAAHSVAVVGNQLQFTAPVGFAGVVTLSYTMTDANGSTGTGLATVTVAPALPTVPPVALSDVAVATPATPVLVDVLANDVDAAGGGLTLSAAEIVLSLPSATHVVAVVGNQLQFTAAGSFAGVVTLSYVATDRNNSTATGLVTVTVAPALPVALPAAVGDTGSLLVTLLSGSTGTFDVLGNDIDPAGGGLTLQSVRFQNPLLAPVGALLGVVGNQVQLTVPLLGAIAGVLPVEYTAVDSLGRAITGVLNVTLAL